MAKRKKIDGKKLTVRVLKATGRGLGRGSVALSRSAVAAGRRSRDRHRKYVEDNPVFMARHTATAKSVDWFSELVWRIFDKRDLKAGKITQEEWDAYMANPSGIEQWRRDVLLRRRENRARQRDLRAPGEWSSVTQTYRVSSADLAAIPDPVVAPAPQQPAFRVPQPRKNKRRVIAPGTASVFRGPRRRRPPATATRRVDRPTQLRAAWGEHWKNQKETAMADVNVQSAISCLQSLADQQPTDRGELHAQLAAFAALGEALGQAAEKIKGTLERPQKDGSPGVPTEVTTHLTPVAEAGETIARACQDTANAFEDRFELAIRAAQDEQKMSDEFLRKAPA